MVVLNAPGNCQGGDGSAAEPDKRFGAADRLPPHREVLADDAGSVKPATTQKNRRFSVTVRAALFFYE